jgi:hypothetical protein
VLLTVFDFDLTSDVAAHFQRSANAGPRKLFAAGVEGMRLGNQGGECGMLLDPRKVGGLGGKLDQ